MSGGLYVKILPFCLLHHPARTPTFVDGLYVYVNLPQFPFRTLSRITALHAARGSR